MVKLTRCAGCRMPVPRTSTYALTIGADGPLKRAIYRHVGCCDIGLARKRAACAHSKVADRVCVACTVPMGWS